MWNKVLVLLTVLMVGGTAAHAGHGTIRETDTEIIIEYSGDAEDKLQEGNRPNSGPAAAPQALPADANRTTPVKAPEKPTAVPSPGSQPTVIDKKAAQDTQTTPRTRRRSSRNSPQTDGQVIEE